MTYDKQETGVQIFSALFNVKNAFWAEHKHVSHAFSPTPHIPSTNELSKISRLIEKASYFF